MLRGGRVQGVTSGRSKIVVKYLANSFTETLENGESHDSMIFFTFFNDFRWCMYSCDDPIAQKATDQVQ